MFVVAFACGAAIAATTVDAREVFKRASRSVVVVEASAIDGDRLGSGVVVSKGRVITNRHVVEGAMQLVVRQGSARWRAEIARISESTDLAELQVFVPVGEEFPLAAPKTRPIASIEIGERVYAIGSPKGLEQSISEGIVSGVHQAATMIQTTAAISSGSSGGGLFDSSGRLVGFTTLYLRDAQTLNFAIATDAIASLVQPPSPTANAACAEFLRLRASESYRVEQTMLIERDRASAHAFVESASRAGQIAQDPTNRALANFVGNLGVVELALRALEDTCRLSLYQSNGLNLVRPWVCEARSRTAELLMQSAIIRTLSSEIAPSVARICEQIEMMLSVWSDCTRGDARVAW